jgi:hypothetical protein
MIDLSGLDDLAAAAAQAAIDEHELADGDLDSTNEYNTEAVLNGTNLDITDGGGTQTVDLSSLNNNGTDDQCINLIFMIRNFTWFSCPLLTPSTFRKIS